MALLLRLVLLVVLLMACGSEAPSGSRCEIGRSLPCACLGGGDGAQECSPAGVYGVCRCLASDAGADAPADVASDAGEDVAAAGDATEDATRDATEDRALTDAPAAGDTADVAGPAPLNQRLDHVEVWVSLNGAPLRLVGGTCVRSASQVFVNARNMARLQYPLGEDASAPRLDAYCTALGEYVNAPGATFEAPVDYVVAGTRRTNVHAQGTTTDLAGTCPATEVEVYAFGCSAM